ncbi:MAG: hypothetical protein HY897_15175 [Deltaproteobacteria bacterium]|nr:hypothetical protein [Deltaproteobacteria bacterium]
MKLTYSAVFVVLLISIPATVLSQSASTTFEAGSLIIPMDLAYQDKGMFQAYGLLFQLLRQGVPVAWVIDPAKTWHAAPCDTAGDTCAWDCAIEGAGQKCPYPTASPDFFAAAKVVWDDSGQLSPGTAISSHGYRGGPFVIAAASRQAAMAVIDAWNDKARWAANPWAERTVFNVVSVHEATAPFQGVVAKEMAAAPTIAVFSDGNENIATAYLLAAGIPQSSGAEFPAGKCGASNCGPGTANPDMLTVQAIMGDMGTCDAVNTDHKNGALFNADGLPAYCQIMSMHWGVNDRETVQCAGGNCPATPAECAGQKITYHGHEVVAEVRSFLQYPTHFFAECQAVNAYENTAPNEAWPFLDDQGRDGHFLTTQGTPANCPCTDGEFTCVAGGCQGGDCCLPKDIKEKGAGFMIAAQPASDTLKILRPNIAYNQFDGAFATVGGSEPAYNLSDYLGTAYKNNQEVTFITGPAGPGDQDVWMTGYVDGLCDIGCKPSEPFCSAKECTTSGKVSYLGGHQYGTKVPLSSNGNSQGTRLFLNALFEADCVTRSGQPDIDLSLIGDSVVVAKTLPAVGTYLVGYENRGAGVALSAVMRLGVSSGVSVTEAGGGGTIEPPGATWSIGSISGVPTPAGDPPSSGTRPATLQFSSFGETKVQINLGYRVGASDLEAPTKEFTILVSPESDGGSVSPDTGDSGTDGGSSLDGGGGQMDGGAPGDSGGLPGAQDAAGAGDKPGRGADSASGCACATLAL